MYCVHTGQWSCIPAVPVNATSVISMLNYLLCKSSLASGIAIRDHMYHNEIYLFWCSLPPVLIWTKSFRTLCIWFMICIPVYQSSNSVFPFLFFRCTWYTSVDVTALFWLNFFINCKKKRKVIGFIINKVHCSDEFEFHILSQYIQIFSVLETYLCKCDQFKFLQFDTIAEFHHHQSVLPEGRSFTARTGTKAAVLPGMNKIYCFLHPTLSLASEQTLKDLKKSQGHQREGEESGFG